MGYGWVNQTLARSAHFISIMDILTILGITIGVGAIVIGNSMEGGTVSFLLQPVPLFIVVGGTVGAAMVQSCTSSFKRALAMLPWVFFRHRAACEISLVDVMEWNRVLRDKGVIAFEQYAENIRDPFVKRAVTLMADGQSAEKIESTLEIELEEIHHDEMLAVQVYESMGGYSPTVGLIGAILGLIQVMQNITNPEHLGQGISIAFVATIYGLLMANMVFIPLAKKLEMLVNLRARHHEMITAAIVALSRRENPQQITSRLEAYLSHMVNPRYSLTDTKPSGKKK